MSGAWLVARGGAAKKSRTLLASQDGMHLGGPWPQRCMPGPSSSLLGILVGLAQHKHPVRLLQDRAGCGVSHHVGQAAAGGLRLSQGGRG